MGKKSTDRLLKFRFDYTSLLIFLLILSVEICIGLFVDDKIIRPYGGDFLVVILLYYLLKSFVKTKPIYLLAFVLVLAFAIEFAQYFDIVSVLGLESNRLMRTVIGTSFSWGDLVAYTLGVITCWFVETKVVTKNK